MAGLSKIRQHPQAANQFRQANLKQLLTRKRAVLVDMGFVNAITASLISTSRMSMGQALSYALRWLKQVALPSTSSEYPMEVTVRQHRWLLCTDFNCHHSGCVSNTP